MRKLGFSLADTLDWAGQAHMADNPRARKRHFDDVMQDRPHPARFYDAPEDQAWVRKGYEDAAGIGRRIKFWEVDTKSLRPCNCK